MPVQTTLTNKINFPDGAKVSVKASGESSWTDIGAVMGDITLTLNWTENQIITANAGRLAKRIRDMIIDGSFNLIQIDPDNINRLSGNLFTKATTNASEVLAAAFTDQTLTDIAFATMYDLDPIVTATGVHIKFSAAPVVTVKLGEGSLTAGTDYVISANANSPSGYSIVFIDSANIAADDDIVLDWGNNTPLASTTLYCGSSDATLDAYALRFAHTNESSVEDRALELYSVDPTAGGFQFGFKSADTDGVEELPVTFQGKVDSTKADGRQLFAWTQA